MSLDRPSRPPPALPSADDDAGPLDAQRWLERGADAAFLVTSARILAYANEKARALLQAGYLFVLSDSDRLDGAGSDIAASLRRTMEGVLRTGETRVFDVILPCRPRYQISLRSLARPGEVISVAILARNIDEHIQCCVAVAATHFHLSDAESRLLAGLLSGQSPQDYAAACQIKISTIRTQLRSLFVKTEATRQSDLAVKVALLPLP